MLVQREARWVRDAHGTGRVRERVVETFWSGDGWVPERDAAKSFATSEEAHAARKWLDSDRDVLILVVVGSAPQGASA